MSFRNFVLVFVLYCFSLELSGQGCSDAGFCTLQSFKPQPENSFEKEKGNQFKIGTSYGIGDYSISAVGTYLEFNRIFSAQFSMDAKLATLAQVGNGISQFGFSDLYVNANYHPAKGPKITLGIKVPFNRADKNSENLPLPMDYQASLGTLDLIAGVGYQIKKFQFVVAWQQPLTQNKNEFLAEDYPTDSKLSKFQSTNEYVRRGDVLLRISYPLSLSSKFLLTPGILPIYHLGNDRFTDSSGNQKDIDGSEGLTLNVSGHLDYKLNNTNSLQLSIGAPLIARDVRPDGLTRKFVASLEYRIKF